MTAHLVALGFAAVDPLRLAGFWAGVLGRELVDDPREGIELAPSDATGFRLRFQSTAEPKVGQGRMHFDLTSSSPEEQQQTVARSLELGAQHIDVGQLPEEGHVVLADPEGNEFCVIEAGNNFLSGTGFIGALNCDGTREVGYFWSEALGWPLVWDQDEETAIQSRQGGPKIAWGGPPLMPRLSKDPLHLEVAPSVDGDQQSEVERLVALGASLLESVRGGGGRIAMADPDGNEFSVLPPGSL